ncbi:hypothetical protein GDO81_022054, partial [Engystomops pustulosus]
QRAASQQAGEVSAQTPPLLIPALTSWDSTIAQTGPQQQNTQQEAESSPPAPSTHSCSWDLQRYLQDAMTRGALDSLGQDYNHLESVQTSDIRGEHETLAPSATLRLE